MNNRSLFILTISLGVIAGLLLMFDAFSQKKRMNWNLPENRSIVEFEDLRNTKKMVLKDGDSISTIQLDDGNRWNINEYYSAAIDRSTLDRFVNALAETEITRFVTRKSEKAASLNLGQQTISFLDGNDNELTLLKFGNEGKNGGFFVQRENEEETYLCDFEDQLDRKPADWARKTLLEASIEDVKSVSLKWNKTGKSVTLNRETTEADFTLEGGKENESLKTSSVQSNLRTLLSARFTKLHEQSNLSDDLDASLAEGIDCTLLMFDDSTVHLQIGRTTQIVETENEEGEKETSEEHGPVYATYSGKGQSVFLPVTETPLAYEFSSYTYTSLPKSVEDWVEVKVEEASD